MMTDPPYSAYTHAKQWIGSALTDDGKPRVSTAHKELGFEALTPELRRDVCREAYRLVNRWTLAFCDLESIWAWREDLRGAWAEAGQTADEAARTVARWYRWRQTSRSVRDGD